MQRRCPGRRGAFPRSVESGLLSKSSTTLRSQGRFLLRQIESHCTLNNCRHKLVAASLALFTIGAVMSGPAQAESTPHPMPAPIGHRQPTARDLPPDVLRDEGMLPAPTLHQRQAPTLPPGGLSNSGGARAGRSQLDKELQICRDC
jgi:hypothetical protein